MYKQQKVSVVIPTYNEAGSIRKVCNDFFATGVVDEVIVVDNNALGNTRSEVLATPATLVSEEKQGYGAALMKGLREATGDIIVMCEADGTFEANDIHKFLLYSDTFDVVFGTRTSRATIFSGAFMPFPVRFANWLWAKFIEVLYNGPVLTDVGCTYKLIKRNVVEKIEPFFSLSPGDGTFSPELMIWILKSGFYPIEIPVLYKPRIGQSMYTGSIMKAAKLGAVMLPVIIGYRHRLFKRFFSFCKTYRTEIYSTILAVIMAVVISYTAMRFPNDDQFILYRYVDNILAGHGFVYNVGEKILASTTPLFTLISTFFAWLFPHVYIPDVVGYLNIICFALSAGLFYNLGKRLLSPRFALFATVIYILNLARMIPEGMETPLFLLFLFSFFITLFDEKYYLSATFLTLTLLVRPDAGLVALLACIYWWNKKGFGETVRLTAFSVIIALPWVVFSTLYFGSFVPESLLTKLHSAETVIMPRYQAFKVLTSSISRMYWGRVFDPEHIPVQVVFNLLPVLVLILASLKKIWTKDCWILFATPVLYVAAFSLSNPVMFPWYVSQIEPLWILLSVIGLSYIYRRYVSITAYAAYVRVGIILLFLVGPMFLYGTYIFTRSQGTKTSLFEMASFVQTHQTIGETVGLSNIGIVGFVTKAYIIDFIGLTRPDSVFYYPAEGECIDTTQLYTIPPKLIQSSSPDWLIAGDGEMDPCFRVSKWFTDHYVPVYSVGTARVYKKIF